jgi:hypothetical protein
MQRYKKHLIIVGSARSGTSWLAEILATQFRYRLLFEPDHEFQTTNGKLICDKFITQNNESQNSRAYLKKVFSNNVDCDWIAQCSNRRYKMHLWPLLPKKYIIKFVRANLSAYYMNTHFDIPVIHLIRNPYDVIHSQQRVRFPWLYDLSHFKNQSDLVNIIDKEFNFNIIETDHFTELETLTLRWCIENMMPLHLNQKNNQKVNLIKYEDLKNNISLFYELCEMFNMKPLKDIEIKYKQPSSKTHPKSTIRKGNPIAFKFSENQLKEINAILDCFKLTIYKRQS